MRPVENSTKEPHIAERIKLDIFLVFEGWFYGFQGWFLVFHKLIFSVSRMFFFLGFEVVLFSCLINFWFSRLNNWWITYLRLCNVTDQWPGGIKDAAWSIHWMSVAISWMELWQENKSWRRHSIIIFVCCIVDHQLRNIILITSGG